MGFNGQAQVVVQFPKRVTPEVVFAEFDIQGDRNEYSTEDVVCSNPSIWPQGLWSDAGMYTMVHCYMVK